ncbi:MAG: hypothetical protein GY795_27790, partial [Desulfobacterales bacterium]|nr:hypothetical protein [Desulfobacterales bacterium]
MKENLIINTYSNEIRRKLFALPDDTPMNEVIKQMETLEQAARESKMTGNSASGKSSTSSARLQAAQTQGRRFPDSVDDESDFDYTSVYEERSVDFESDELDDGSSDSDVQQKISSLANQLAKLQTSVDRKTRAKG